MGNRAVVTFENDKHATGIYLHWNGGPESVLAFCHAARDMGARRGQEAYAMAGILRAVTLFMHTQKHGELLSVGVATLDQLDTNNGNNGTYIIGENWDIAERHLTDDTARQVLHLSGDQQMRYAGIYRVIMERHALLCDHAVTS